MRSAGTDDKEAPEFTGLRLGVCCLFREAPIHFRTTTAAACRRLSERDRLAKLHELCQHNADSLLEALKFCRKRGIGAFRVNSQILPLATHPEFGYQLEDLHGGAAIIDAFQQCGTYAKREDIRTSFHPDQYVVLNSLREEVVASSIDEIEYQTSVAELIGADVVNIHGGGAYGAPHEALDRLARNLERLSPAARERLTLENDDKIYSVADLLPLCRREGAPMVYDVHHHRCHSDEYSVEEATELAAATWNREPLVHISSPKEGWSGPARHRHHDYVDPADFPACWLGRRLTVEVEAKAKELAVAALRLALQDQVAGTGAARPVKRRR